MVKAMAIEGVTYSKRRKVTNSISAQGEVKKIVPVELLHAWLPSTGQDSQRDFGKPCKDTGRHGVVRCAALSGRTAGTAPHALHSKAQSRLHLRGSQCFCTLAVKREKGGAGWRSCRRKT